MGLGPARPLPRIDGERYIEPDDGLRRLRESVAKDKKMAGKTTFLIVADRGRNEKPDASGRLDADDASKQRGQVAVSQALSAFWLTPTMAMPVASMKPFWEPETARSTPHSSMRKSIEASEDTQST